MLHAMLHETFESVCGDYDKSKNRADKWRIELRVEKMEPKCGRSWVFTCRLRDPIPDRFKSEMNEWRDDDALLVTPRFGIIGESMESGTLACLRYAR